MHFILDCETLDSAIQSLAVGFNCFQNELIDVLTSLDLEALYGNSRESVVLPPEDILYNYVIGKLGAHSPLESVCWFHCTRTDPKNMFVEGILPLDNSKSLVWNMMLEFSPNDATRIRLRKLHDKGITNELYDLRVNDSTHWGPFGILVKEVAFHAEELSQHDYLRVPELVEDICNEFEDVYGEQLINHYEKVLVPKIIKFRSEKWLDAACIKSALGYAYSSLRDKSPDGLSIYGFDAECDIIAPEQIICIETIQP